MKYCKKCLQPDTRPNTKFDSNGICPACKYSDSLKEVDWDDRKREIHEIVQFGKDNNYSGYDCIIGVSGGKDSTRQAIFVKEILGMKPLLVCLSYPPEQVTQRGVDNISNLISMGFDAISILPSPVIWKKLMKKGFMEYCNWCKSTELALFSSVPRFAITYQIPLIWWGENTALQLGDLGAMGNSGSDGNFLRNINTLSGGDIRWLLDKQISKNRILQYCYPSQQDMNYSKLRIVFLGYFWKDWSLRHNGTFSTLRGLEIRNESPEDIGDYVEVSALDENWVTLNQMIKYLKYGFGRATDCANEDIRNGVMSRKEAINLVKRYDGKCSDVYIQSFCDYIGISEKTFWEVVDKHTNKKLFKKNKHGNWVPKFNIGDEYKES